MCIFEHAFPDDPIGNLAPDIHEELQHVVVCLAGEQNLACV